MSKPIEKSQEGLLYDLIIKKTMIENHLRRGDYALSRCILEFSNEDMIHILELAIDSQKVNVADQLKKYCEKGETC